MAVRIPSRRSVNARITIADVAKRVGVARSTVSHALSGKRPITAEVRQRVQDAIRELGYKPSFAARSLALNKTGMIGVLVSEVYNPYTGTVLDALERELVKHGYKVLLGLSNGQLDRITSYLDEFGSGMVDGLINLEPTLDPGDLIRQLPNIPSVTYMRSGNATPRVYLDFADGAEKAIEHLWLLGHRKIGYISGPLVDLGAQHRLNGVQRFFLRQRVEIRPEWIKEGDWSIEGGERMVWPLVDSGCTAVLTGNDLMAIGAIRGLRSRNIVVPRDISIVGFDDSPLATLVDPPLTTVQIPVIDLVRATVEELMDLMAGRSQPQAQVISPSLIIRSSTGPVKAS